MVPNENFGCPVNPEEICAWFLVGSCNLAKAAVSWVWGLDAMNGMGWVGWTGNRICQAAGHDRLVRACLEPHFPSSCTSTQWGERDKAPTNFELSVLLTTPDPGQAARWLDTLPLKLPPGDSLTGLEQSVVVAARYPTPANGTAYERDDPAAPFNFAFDKPEVFNAAQDKALAAAAAQAQLG